MTPDSGFEYLYRVKYYCSPDADADCNPGDDFGFLQQSNTCQSPGANRHSTWPVAVLHYVLTKRRIKPYILY